MRIGVHPNNLHLRLARLWPGSFAGFEPEFIAYDEGRDTASLLASGTIHFGGTGSTPPIEADASGLGVHYVAASAPRPANGAILARAGSEIRTISDLAGKRISLVDGSFHTYLLARSLEGEGLGLPDVIRVESGNLDSLRELLDGRIDAWVAMSPRLEKVSERRDLRVIARCGSTIPNRSLFWTLERHALSQETVKALVEELDRIGRDVTADVRKAAELLAAENRSEGDVDAWLRVLGSRDFSVVPAGDAIIAEQQAEADTLHRHGHFSNPVALRRPAPLA